jgi:hypothetical protein
MSNGVGLFPRLVADTATAMQRSRADAHRLLDHARLGGPVSLQEITACLRLLGELEKPSYADVARINAANRDNYQERMDMT